MSIIEHIIAFCAPHHCLKCGSEGQHLCKSCILSLPSLSATCYRCGAVSEDGVCSQCSLTVKLHRLVCATSYQGSAKDILRELKFNRGKRAARDIAWALHSRLPILPANAIVSFLPTANSRVRQRGYDQAALIAKEFAALRKLPFTPLLVRLKNNRQVGSLLEERRSNITGAFRIKGGNLASYNINKTIVLIDDVITTGASIEEAAMVLCKAGAVSIWAVAFARVE